MRITYQREVKITSSPDVPVAGRCLSATSDAAGAVRVMPPCMAMGQAAGVDITPAEVDVAALRKNLIEQGAYLG